MSDNIPNDCHYYSIQEAFNLVNERWRASEVVNRNLREHLDRTDYC